MSITLVGKKMTNNNNKNARKVAQLNRSPSSIRIMTQVRLILWITKLRMLFSLSNCLLAFLIKRQLPSDAKDYTQHFIVVPLS
jgi:hypothetical protein